MSPTSSSPGVDEVDRWTFSAPSATRRWFDCARSYRPSVHPEGRGPRPMREDQRMTERLEILFVCSQNRIRSVTAEKLFEGNAAYDVRSAGTELDARIKLTAGHIGWADRIFVMEKRHRDRIRKKFREELRGKEVI